MRDRKGVFITWPGEKEKSNYPVRGIFPEVDRRVKSIPENLKPGSTVGELIAEVRDADDELEFTLVDHPAGFANDNDLFEIKKQSTGQSYLTVNLFAQFNHLNKPILIINQIGRAHV